MNKEEIKDLANVAEGTILFETGEPSIVLVIQDGHCAYSYDPEKTTAVKALEDIRKAVRSKNLLDAHEENGNV